jgi:hypothetical protein
MSSPEMGYVSTTEKQEETARLNSIQRLFGTLFSPGETFQDINRKPDWIVPMVLAIVLFVAGNFVILKRLNLDGEKITRQAIEQQLQKQGKSLSDIPQDQLESQIKISAKIQQVAPIIFTPICVAFLALVFWGVSIVMGGQTAFKKIFSVTTYSFTAVIVVVGILINTLVAFLRNPEDINILEGIAATNPGMLMPAGTSTILKALLSQFDVINIWFLILMAIGIAAVSKNMKTGKAATVVFGLWAVWIVIKVAFAAVTG